MKKQKMPMKLKYVLPESSGFIYSCPYDIRKFKISGINNMYPKNIPKRNKITIKYKFIYNSFFLS